MDKAYFHALQILLNDEPKKTIIWSILLFDDIVVCPLSHQTRLDSMDHDDVLAPRTCGCFSLCVTQRRSSYLVGSHRKKCQNVLNYVFPCRSWGISWGIRQCQFGNTLGNKRILVTFATNKVVLCLSWGIRWGIGLLSWR